MQGKARKLCQDGKDPAMAFLEAMAVFKETESINNAPITDILSVSC
jgi:hypothetical protein